MGLASLDVDNEAYAAGVVLLLGIVEALRFRNAGGILPVHLILTHHSFLIVARAMFRGMKRHLEAISSRFVY